MPLPSLDACITSFVEDYHILTLNNKGVFWIPSEFARLKSYINSEKVLIK